MSIPKESSLPTKDLIKYASIIQDNATYTCKCGHRVVIGKRGKTFCYWCGSYVYRDKKAEYMDKMSRLCRVKK